MVFRADKDVRFMLLRTDEDRRVAEGVLPTGAFCLCFISAQRSAPVFEAIVLDSAWSSVGLLGLASGARSSPHRAEACEHSPSLLSADPEGSLAEGIGVSCATAASGDTFGCTVRRFRCTKLTKRLITKMRPGGFAPSPGACFSPSVERGDGDVKPDIFAEPGGDCSDAATRTAITLGLSDSSAPRSLGQCSGDAAGGESCSAERCST